MIRAFGLLTFFVPFIYCPLYAQSIEKMEKKAQDHFYHEEFTDAIDEYNKILGVDAKHRLAQYRLTICSLLTNYRRESIENMLIYKKTQGKKDKFYNYWLGRIYFQQSNFKMAIDTWNKFLAMDQYRSSEINNETQEYIKWAEKANEQYNHPQNYEIDQLSEVINSPFIEYSPVYFEENEELLFLSAKSSLVPDEDFDVFHSFRENGNWSTPTPVVDFGKFTASNANIEVVNNDGRLYLYKENSHKHGDLYYSQKGNNREWGELVKVDAGLSSTKLESHFFINEQENRILFAHRNSSGKRFDLDLYQSRKNPENGKWEKPTLFSENITSEFDEDFPFLTPDEKTIYFSSKGFNSLGKYDVFKSEWDDNLGTWSEPTSLNYPTNSTDNDIQFKIDHESNSGYFVSDRIDAFGGYDIFFFHESAKVLLSGIVVDSLNKPVDHAQIQFFPSRKTGLLIKAMTDGKGEFSVRVGNDEKVRVDIYFHDKKVHSEMIETPHSSGDVIPMRVKFSLDKEKKPAEPDVVIDKDPEFTTVEEIGSKFRLTNRAKIPNIYFESGSYELNDNNVGKISSLLKALQDYPDLRIEVAGHTDNLGSSEVNLKLSQQRTGAVVDYLIHRGIDSNRLIPKGYGDTKPLASNDDEKDGRELNRRIVVVVLE